MTTGETAANSGAHFRRGLGRAFGGAIVFSLPLLMTMEMWHLGFYIDDVRLLILMLAVLPLLVGLSHFVGFEPTFGWKDDLVDALVAFAVGFVAAAPVLAILGLIAPGMSARRPSDVSPAEWAWACAGLLLVLATIAYLAHRALSGRDMPPDIRLRAESVVQTGGGYLLTITATNDGDRTAAGVYVSGELRNGGAVIESSRMRFQYLPAHSERKGGLYFLHDPRRADVVLAARGYELP